jgi:hypothetical protein
VGTVAVLTKLYKRCPEGKLLVVYGGGLPDSCVVVDSGGRFVLPLFQDFACLSLAPLNVPLPRQEGRQITVKIGESAEQRRNAAICLLRLSEQEMVAHVQELLRSRDHEGNDQSLRETLATVGLEIV